MLTVIGYHKGDLDQAQRLASWMRELGPYPGHRLLVARDSSTEARPFENVGFDSVQEIVITDDHWHRWPESPNNVFKKVAKHIEYTKPEPWLWLEPDVAPLVRGWLDALTEEYFATGKLFMGDFVSVHTAEIDVPDHMSGVGIYPGMMTAHAGVAVISLEIAWDVAAAPQILPLMHRSTRIVHNWRHPEFNSQDEVNNLLRLHPNCVLFHADKSGSLIKFLKEQYDDIHTTRSHYQTQSKNEALQTSLLLTSPGQGASNLPDVHETIQKEQASTDSGSRQDSPSRLQGDSGQAGNLREVQSSDAKEVPGRSSQGLQSATLRPMVMPALSSDRARQSTNDLTCDILIKSYPKDYELLSYCLRAIEKFARGFRQVVVVYPQGHSPIPMLSELSPFAFDTVNNWLWTPMVENGNGYLVQQTVKAGAHEWTDADYVLHIDSDVILCQPITPETFFRDGKPLWLMTPYDKLDVPWQPITEKFLGEPVQFEFMRRLPILVPRFLHLAASAFCQAKHGMRLTDYILSQPNGEFSEFNALGALAYARARDQFTWLNTHE